MSSLQEFLVERGKGYWEDLVDSRALHLMSAPAIAFFLAEKWSVEAFIFVLSFLASSFVLWNHVTTLSEGRMYDMVRERMTNFAAQITENIIPSFKDKDPNVNEGLATTASTKSGRVVWIQRDRDTTALERWAYVAGERYDWNSVEEAVKDISTWE